MNESSNTNSCVIELHYCLKDNSHSMDAFIFNECEREFLAIVREVIKKSGTKVDVETEALGKGGICCFLTSVSPEDLERIKMIAEIIYFLVSTGYVTYKWIRGSKTQEKTTESKSEPYKRVTDTKKLLQYIDKKILRSRSNFYANLLLCDAVEGLTIRATDENGVECFTEKRIAKDDFKEFIMSDNNVVPECINDAIIEIISPVIRDRKYKWTGTYNNETIRFNMWDEDFKNKVRTGQISFNDDFSIRCHLMIRRKIDNEGNVRKEYEVIDVTGISD